MVITLPRRAALDSARPHLEAKLEQEYEGHTEQLARLIQRRQRRTTIDLDAATAQAREALGEVAQALRRIAEGRYGTCEQCRGDIEMDQLEESPAARYCRGCEPSTAA